MLQRKRDQFRKQIRANQLQKYRQQKRKQFENTQLKPEAFFKIDQAFIQLENVLQGLSVNRKQLNQQNNIMSENNENEISLNIFQRKQTTFNISNIADIFQTLKATTGQNYEEIFTKYIMNKQSAQRISRILIDLIRNQVQSDSQSEQHFQEFPNKYSSIVRDYTISEIIKFLDTLQYFAMGQSDTVFLIINAVWQLLTDKFVFDQKDDYAVLTDTLSIVAKLLLDIKNEQVYRYLKKKGVGNQIYKVINVMKKFNLDIKTHRKMIKVIQNYCQCEISIPPLQSQIPDKIGVVTIQTSNVDQKQYMMGYCVSFIDRKQQSLYPQCFNALSKLFQTVQFLVSTLKFQYIAQILQLIFHPNRQIQNGALNLINDICYHSQESLNYLLEKQNLLDLLYKRLMMEKNIDDGDVKGNIQRIAYIICNSTYTQKPQIKTIVDTHYIWQQIFSSCHPSNKLFPLIMTMHYYLNFKGHTKFEVFLVPYLQTLQQFDWQNCNYSKAIELSITGQFFAAQQFWQDYQYRKLLRIYLDKGFFYLIEDCVEEDDLKHVRGDTMQ